MSGIAQDPPQTLVAGVASAQHVAVHQQHTLAMQVDDGAVLEQRAAGLGGEARADEKIAIAVHEIRGYSRIVQCAQLRDDRAYCRIGVVVAEPGFEQVAEDVERTRCACLAAQEIHELSRDPGCRGIEVQVRDQQRLAAVGVHLGVAASPTMRAVEMTTGCRGASSWNGPLEPVATLAIRSTTSMPSTTRPKTA